MINRSEDTQQILEHKRFLNEIEQHIQEINKEIIHQKIPQLNKKNITLLAERIAALRGQYLQCAFNLSLENPDALCNDENIRQLRRFREMFEEMREAFHALTYAVGRGYLVIQQT